MAGGGSDSHNRRLGRGNGCGGGASSALSRKKTFVLERRGDGLWCAVETEWQNLLTARPGAKIELLETYRSVRPPSAQLPIGRFADEYHLLRRLHSRQGRPFLLADVYV
jgi:GntR family transcriptional regulator